MFLVYFSLLVIFVILTLVGAILSFSYHSSANWTLSDSDYAWLKSVISYAAGLSAVLGIFSLIVIGLEFKNLEPVMIIITIVAGLALGCLCGLLGVYIKGRLSA